jgi:hypothetical protein
MTIDLSRWPCGHPRNALNTRRIGDDREVCARCRSDVNRRHYVKRRDAEREAQA